MSPDQQTILPASYRILNTSRKKLLTGFQRIPAVRKLVRTNAKNWSARTRSTRSDATRNRIHDAQFEVPFRYYRLTTISLSASALFRARHGQTSLFDRQTGQDGDHDSTVYSFRTTSPSTPLVRHVWGLPRRTRRLACWQPVDAARRSLRSSAPNGPRACHRGTGWQRSYVSASARATTLCETNGRSSSPSTVTDRRRPTYPRSSRDSDGRRSTTSASKTGRSAVAMARNPRENRSRRTVRDQTPVDGDQARSVYIFWTVSWSTSTAPASSGRRATTR